jgi:ribosomal protein S18 acetylase RimI-like enzyme
LGIDQLYKLKKKDLKKSTEIMANAFFDYPIFEHIAGEKHNKENLKTILKYYIKYSMIYGNAYATSPDLEGIILFIDYDNYKFNIFRSLRSGGLSLLKLGSDLGKRFNEFDKFCDRIHKKLINRTHKYIMFIGVDPEEQGQGYGGKLLELIIKETEKDKEPIYLETHSKENVAIYEKYGFIVKSEDLVPGSNIKQWSMIKE